MKTAACYIRVSTDRQAELSPESQLLEIQRYAELHGYQIPENFIYTDEGIPGKSVKNRPAFNEMLKAAKCKPKPFEVLLLWKFSRFARNKTEAVVYKSLLRNQCGIEVISVSENIGEDRGTAVILESMLEAMDEYYSINLATEVKRSMLMKAQKGEPVCPAPFGYRNENKRYVIDEKQALIVKKIFEWYLSGVGKRQIAQRLDVLSVTTKRGNRPDNRFVDYILQNPTYCGKIRWNPSGKAANKSRYRKYNEDMLITQGNHEPIISEETFELVQNKIEAQRNKNTQYQNNAKTEWMLRGLLRCSACGAALVKSSQRSNCVQCQKYNRGQCKFSHSITLSKADKIIITVLEKYFLSVCFDVEIKARTTAVNEKQILEKMLQSETKRLLKVREAFELEIDTAQEYKENKRRITETIKQLQDEITCFSSKKSPTDSDKKKNINLYDFLTSEKVSERAKNKALCTVVEKIVFDRTAKKFEVYLIFNE